MRSFFALTRLAVMVFAMNVVLAGCYALGSSGNQSAAAGPPVAGVTTADGVGVDQAVEQYTTAVNSGNLEGIVGAFEPGGMVVDVGREIKGAEAIRRWANNEVVGGHIEVLERHPRAGGIDLLIRFTPPGSSGGFRAWYRFDVNAGRIAQANLTYA